MFDVQGFSTVYANQRNLGGCIVEKPLLEYLVCPILAC